MCCLHCSILESVQHVAISSLVSRVKYLIAGNVSIDNMIINIVSYLNSA